MTIPQGDILVFLQQRGYEIKPWLWSYQDETFPNGTTRHESWTFTATKPWERQCENTHYMTVFEEEINGVIKNSNILLPER